MLIRTLISLATLVTVAAMAGCSQAPTEKKPTIRGAMLEQQAEAARLLAVETAKFAKVNAEINTLQVERDSRVAKLLMDEKESRRLNEEQLRRDAERGLQLLREAQPYSANLKPVEAKYGPLIEAAEKKRDEIRQKIDGYMSEIEQLEQEIKSQPGS